MKSNINSGTSNVTTNPVIDGFTVGWRVVGAMTGDTDGDLVGTDVMNIGSLKIVHWSKLVSKVSIDSFEFSTLVASIINATLA